MRGAGPAQKQQGEKKTFWQTGCNEPRQGVRRTGVADI